MTARYNILFIVSDQEYAHQALPEGLRLPNHELLAARGVMFSNYHVTTTLCSPSRACMYTGLHTPLNGIWDNENTSYIPNLSTEIPTMGHMLREAGYYTAYLGKWHLSHQSYDQSRSDELEPYGFADFQETGSSFGRAAEGMWRDAVTASDASRWLMERSGAIAEEQSWCLAVNFINPHDIMFYHAGEGHGKGRLNVADDPDTALYRQRWDVSLPASFDDNLMQHPAAVANFAEAIDRMHGPMPTENLSLWKNHINYYLNCLCDVDQHLGTVLDALEATGQAEKTIIVYTSDHGELAGAHGLRQKGMVAFREVVNVPFIVVHPDGKEGASTTAVGSAIDLVPTMLAWAGVSDEERAERYPQLKGHDLTSAIINPNASTPRGDATEPGTGTLFTFDCLYTYDSKWFRSNLDRLLENDPIRSAARDSSLFIRDPAQIFEEIDLPDLRNRNLLRGIFDGRYKLVRHFALNNYHLPASVDDLLAHNDVALYDLQNDPHEMINLANPAHPDYDERILAEMNRKLNALILAEVGEDENKVGL